jgi:hypothetical protein
LSILALLPLLALDRFDLLAVNKDDTSTTEIGWCVELEVGLIFGNWESHSVVVSNVVLLLGVTDLLVGDLGHVSNSLGAETFFWCFVQSVLKLLQVIGSRKTKAGGLGEDGAVVEWVSLSLDAVMAVLIGLSYWFWNDRAVLPSVVDVSFGEVHEFSVVDGERPVGGSVTAFLGTFDFDNVHTSFKVYSEVELGALTVPPDIFLFLNDNLAINKDHTSVTEIRRHSELPVHLGADRNGQLVVETNVLALATSTDLSVTEVHHLGQVFLTVALGHFLGSDGLVELGNVLDHVGFPTEGLDRE